MINIFINYSCFTSSDARKTVEMSVSQRYSDNDPGRILVADLLTHSVSTAKSSYVTHELGDYTRAMNIISLHINNFELYSYFYIQL